VAEDPFLAAARTIILDSLAAMRATIDGLPPGRLNWRPAGDETNSLAALTAHALGSTRNWLAFSLAGPLPERNREAEFRVHSKSADALLSYFDSVTADCERLLDSAGAVDWSAVRQVHGSTAAEQASAAWALVHTVEHLREHLGQALLTRQLGEQRSGS
jgi:hypothetical protein